MKKYLSISGKTSDVFAVVLKAISDGDKYVKFASYKNEKKEKETHPDYTGSVLNTWISEYDETKKKGNESQQGKEA